MVAAGGAVIEILESSGGAPPTQSELDAWINTPGLRNTTVMDPPDMPLASMGALGRREFAYIVDLTTMKIIQKIDGFALTCGQTSAAVGMQQMHALLGK